MDRKQYIKELRWTPQVSEGFLYIDLILHRHVHLIMHTLISISAHIHMKHKKWYVTCVWAKNIYIRIHVSQLASAPRQSSKVDKHSHLFLLLSLQKLSEEFTDSFIKFMLSFFSYIFFFCITRTFHECQIWGSAKWFFSKSNFLLGGECIYLMFTGTWNPSRYFLESEEIWDVQLYSIWGPEESYSG